jgi:hypothetical protein
MLLIILRSLAMMVTILAYSSCLMYEDAEGKWQNRIETLWVAVDDREKLSGSRTSALFNVVATTVMRGFNRVFGPRIFSPQFIGVSTSYSFAGTFLFMAIAFLYYTFLAISGAQGPLSEPVTKALGAALLLGLVLLPIGLFFLALAVLPSLWRSFVTVSLSLIPTVLVVALTVRAIQVHRLMGIHLWFIIATVVSLLTDVLLLLVVRFTVRFISAETKVTRLALAVVLQLAIVAFMVVAPLEGSLAMIGRNPQHPTSMAMFVFFVGVFNIFTGIASCAFVLVLLVVVLHRIAWPLLGRLIYPLARYQVIRNHKVMFEIGTGCFIFAFPLMWNWLRSLLGWVERL